MDLIKIEEIARKIQGQLFKNGQGLSSGLIKTSFKGAGLTFKEHQVYNYGDDVKFIDWKILARLGHPYIRTFEEERNIEIVVFIDATPSMSYGHKGVSKFQAALEICCMLMLTCKKSGDSVQPVIIAENLYILPPNSGKEGMVQLIGALVAKGLIDEQGKVKTERPSTDEEERKKLEAHILGLLKKHKEVVLLSDFKNFLPESILKKALFQKHVHAFQILSPLDEMKKMPFSIFAYNDAKKNGTKAKGARVASQKGSEELIDHLFGKKIKKIRTNQSYLDDFIKALR